MAEMIVPGESGFLVDGSDPAGIVKTIRHDLAANLGRLDEIGRNAAARIREITAPATYAATMAEHITRARGERPPQVPGRPAERKVSVVIPFYKEKEFAGEAVASACAQTHPNLEILVVNDGSPLDDAQEILDGLASRDPRVRVVHKENGGLGSARNRGIREATGDYVLFLDDDDLITPEYAAQATAALERRPELGFLAPYTWFFDAYTQADLGYYNPMPFHRATALIINQFGASGAFFRRDLFAGKDIWYDEILIAYEDWALWMDMARKGVEGDVLPRVCYHYRIRKDSMMSTDGWPNHLALVGLLIHRHFPALGEEEREVLTVLNQMWGAAALEARFANAPEELHQRPAEKEPGPLEADESPIQVAPPPPAPVPLRHKLVDTLAERAHKVPGLAQALRGIAGGMLRLLKGPR